MFYICKLLAAIRRTGVTIRSLHQFTKCINSWNNTFTNVKIKLFLKWKNWNFSKKFNRLQFARFSKVTDAPLIVHKILSHKDYGHRIDKFNSSKMTFPVKGLSGQIFFGVVDFPIKYRVPIWLGFSTIS